MRVALEFDQVITTGENGAQAGRRADRSHPLLQAGPQYPITNANAPSLIRGSILTDLNIRVQADQKRPDVSRCFGVALFICHLSARLRVIPNLRAGNWSDPSHRPRSCLRSTPTRPHSPAIIDLEYLYPSTVPATCPATPNRFGPALARFPGKNLSLGIGNDMTRLTFAERFFSCRSIASRRGNHARSGVRFRQGRCGKTGSSGKRRSSVSLVPPEVDT